MGCNTIFMQARWVGLFAMVAVARVATGEEDLTALLGLAFASRLGAMIDIGIADVRLAESAFLHSFFF